MNGPGFLVRTWRRGVGGLVVAVAVIISASHVTAADHAAWQRHTIDDTSRGADGVRPLDINGDGRLDLVTGWEEGGAIRVYLHPGPEAVQEPWPAVTVGQVKSPEDAVFVDLDGDGHVDVVSCCEGGNRSVFVHWAPTNRDQLLDETAWATEAFPVLARQQLFMFCLPLQVDGRHGVDLVIGSKSRGGQPAMAGQVGWLESPQDPRKLADWRWHPLYEASWIMSLIGEDMDHDGDTDILLTDRKQPTPGCKWLEHPGPERAADAAAWQAHLIGGDDAEPMFAVSADVDRDGLSDVVSATAGSGLQLFRRLDQSGVRWQKSVIAIPAGTGSGKGVHAADIDQDGSTDFVLTCEHADGKHGVFVLSPNAGAGNAAATFRAVSGNAQGAGVKFDLIQLIDVDEDGDLDVITCEERDQLGLIWYENPTTT